MTRKRLGEVLLETGVITRQELEQGLASQETTEKRLGEILLEKGIIDEERLAWCLAEMVDLPLLNLNSIFIDPKVLKILPKERCLALKVLPISIIEGCLTLAMADPLDVMALDIVRALAKMPIRLAVATESSILQNVVKYYSDDVGLEEAVSRIFVGATELASEDEVGLSREIYSTAASEEFLREDSTPVIRLVNSIIRDAIKMRASDIHLEPLETSCIVRYRVDGLLRNMVAAPLFLHPRIVCRFKIMGNMDIAEHRIPQDGSCRVRLRHDEYDLRLSAMPTQFGEKVVVRILNRQEALIRLESTGFLPDTLARLECALRQPQGIILLTGPTGSGKTTTLYSMLHRLRVESRNIVTLEDPIEYNLPGIAQTQIHDKAGLSFAAGFRALLRQDPDVIMVGEIRDGETGDIAFNASVTGHLVLSTLHANDTCSVPVRLNELRVSPFLVSTGLKAIIAQRLVRRLCLHCRVSCEPDADTCRLLGLNPREPVTVYRAGGCTVCHETGFYGRVGIFELLIPSDRIREMMFERASAAQIQEQALREGMRDLMEDAAMRVVQGVTSLEEVMRVVSMEERRRVCPQCQRTVERYYHTCPYCAFPFWKDLCRTCGREMEEGWRFCPHCSGEPVTPGPRMGADLARPDVPVRQLEPARCQSCGMSLRPTWIGCPLCLQPQAGHEGALELELPFEPRTPAAPEPGLPPEGRKPGLPPGPETVAPPARFLVLVTDDPELLMEVRRVARELDLDVVRAGAFEEALRRAARETPAGILIDGSRILDGSLPVWLKRLRSHRPEPLPVAVLASQGDSAQAVCARLAAAAVVLTPLQADQLRATFARLPLGP